MKVFVSADIEGTADLASFAEAGNENPQLYTRGMIQMSREVGAVCRGALSAGAEFVAVKDTALISCMNTCRSRSPLSGGK